MTPASAAALDYFDLPATRLQPRLPVEHANGSLRGLHLITPSQRPNNGAQTGAVVSGSVHRNKATLRKEVEQQLEDALAEVIPAYVTPAKTVAAEIGTSTGTVDNLRQRVPDAMVTLIMIARAYPKFGSQVARLMALDAELDPGFQREFAEFIRRARQA